MVSISHTILRDTFTDSSSALVNASRPCGCLHTLDQQGLSIHSASDRQFTEFAPALRDRIAVQGLARRSRPGIVIAFGQYILGACSAVAKRRAQKPERHHQ